MINRLSQTFTNQKLIHSLQSIIQVQVFQIYNFHQFQNLKYKFHFHFVISNSLNINVNSGKFWNSNQFISIIEALKHISKSKANAKVNNA